MRRLSVGAALMAGPAGDSATIAQLHEGDSLRVLDIRGGWAWGYGPDGQVGYVPEAAITA